MEIAVLLAREKRIDINSDFKRQGMRSDWAVVIKKILMDIPKDIIIATFAKLDQADLLVSKWSFLIGKDSVHIAKAASRDWFKVLLFTLPVGTTAHDFGTLLDRAGGKTCIINRSLKTSNRICCAVVGFESDDNLESAFYMEPIFGSVKLSWTRIDLVWCEKCRKFGHSALKCDAPVAFPSEPSRTFKKVASDEHPAFGGKFWAQVVSLAGPSGGSCFSNSSGSNPPLFGVLDLINNSFLILANNSSLNDYLNTLKCSLKLLTDQVFSILIKLGGMELVPIVIPSSVLPSVTPALLVPRLDVDMTLDDIILASTSISSFSAVNDIVHNSSFSFSKVLTSKVGKLESKIVVFEVSIGSVLEKLDCLHSGINNPAKQDDIIYWHKDINNLISIFTETKLKDRVCLWIANKFNGIHVFTSGLDFGHLSFGVAIVMDNSLARHVCKVSEVPEWLFSIRLLFNNKLSVIILELYASASSDVQAVNKSSFIVLSGDFNKNGLHKSASFKKCLDLSLVNSLDRSLFAKMPIVVVNCDVADVDNHFDSDHRAVSVCVGLSELLDMHLNSIHKQVNKDCWKYDIKNANNKFASSVGFSDLDSMWDIVHKVMVFSANNSFKKKWFKGFDNIFTKDFSRFYRLEILVSRIVKVSHGQNSVRFTSLMSHWTFLDSDKALAVQVLLDFSTDFDCVRTALFGVRKSYHVSKLAKSLRVQESSIRSAINKHIKSFTSDKSHTIRSVLECLFHKVELNHLVVGDKLILKSELVKTKVDVIMEGWTKRHKVVSDIFSKWSYQYQSLEYPVVFDKLFGVIFDLPDGKAGGLSSIPNKFWKHCDNSVIDMLLELLNTCLIIESAWVLMISKPYKWEKVLMNTHFHSWLSNKKCSGEKLQTLASFTGHVMTDFGLTDEYYVKRQESVCEYRLNSHFISKNGHLELIAGLSSFFAAEAFVNDTIWVGSSQSATQYILNIASEFFWVNDISINIDKTVVIPINCKVGSPSLVISGLPIVIVKREEFHQYLGIYLSTKSLSKSSLAKAQSDVWFFSNLVLRKAISDKQFLYLVLANTLVQKNLKLKSSLPLDFPNDSIHHPFFYGLKSFEQVQSEDKIVLLVSFANSGGTLGHMFSHRSYDFPLNNFLAGVVCILAKNNLSLSGSLGNLFCHRSGISMLVKTFKCWKRLDPRGPVPEWFGLSVTFLSNVTSFFPGLFLLGGVGKLLNILESQEFKLVCDQLSCVSTSSLSVYTDGSLRNLGTIQRKTDAAVFFDNIGLGLGIRVTGLLSSTLAELQAIALALECVPSLSSVCLHSDSQTALDVCKLELCFICLDFHIQCWVEHQHIVNIIHCKNLRVNWIKVKNHSGVVENDCADTLAAVAFDSDWHLLPRLKNHCLLAGSELVSGNSRHFHYNKHTRTKKRPKTSGNIWCSSTETTQQNNFKVATTPDTTTLEFNIPDGIEVVKKSVYQYIENCINNYLFGNYNISKVRSNFYNNLVHYSQLETEDLNSKTLATYFQKLNFNIIKYYEKTYLVQSQYSIDFESETETSNKGKQKLKQYSKTTPNTPILPKTTAKHLQTPEQGTKDFTSPRSLTRQQEPLQTSSNLLDFLAENRSEHSETAVNKENNSEISEEESIDSENKEDKMTAYITKIPEFNGENIETSPQEWLDQVCPHAPEDLNSAIQHAKKYKMAMEEANRTKLMNLVIGKTSSAAEEKIDQLTKKDFHQTAFLEGRAAAQQQNSFYTPTTIPPARIAENANFSDIFPFEFKANESPFLFSNAATNEQKAITAMYTEAEVEGKAIRLILDSGFAGSIITYQLIQQLKRNVD
ncbi:hypothetical protein G9A89_016763 [Geosiphon pyriformis]|nr:hypothetical protein G9A89_016763 [Geosiphon pyriformis]